MDLKSFYHQYRMIIWPVASGLASLIILSLVIIPQFLDYLKTRDQILQTQNQASKLEAKAVELAQFDQTEVQRKLETVYAVLPTDQDVPKSLAILQGLIRTSALELKNTSYIAPRKGVAKPNFQLNVTVIGPVSLIRSFILSLKEAPQIFQIDSINIKFAGGGSAVEATIPISVFYEEASKGLIKSDQPLPKLSREEEELLAQMSKVTAGMEASSSAVSGSVPLGKTDPFE